MDIVEGGKREAFTKPAFVLVSGLCFVIAACCYVFVAVDYSYTFAGQTYTGRPELLMAVSAATLFLPVVGILFSILSIVRCRELWQVAATILLCANLLTAVLGVILRLQIFGF